MVLLDTTLGWVEGAAPLKAGTELQVGPQSVVLLQRLVRAIASPLIEVPPSPPDTSAGQAGVG